VVKALMEKLVPKQNRPLTYRKVTNTKIINRLDIKLRNTENLVVLGEINSIKKRGKSKSVVVPDEKLVRIIPLKMK
jgi:hypothetical protein